VNFRLGALAGIGLTLAAIALFVLVSIVRREGPDRELYPVAGIDVSHHQGEIDWPRVAADDVEFAFIKATEGRDFSDPRFAFNWEASGASGIARGAYHFFTFCSAGLEQAEHFLRVVPPEPGALTPVADVEFGGNCTSYEDLEVVRQELDVFLREVERAWGRKPILYLTFRSKLQIADARFDGYPVWFRNIFWRLPSDASSLWSVWQHADDGEVSGIAGPVDRNVLHPDVSVASITID
jgi:lysozyme